MKVQHKLKTYLTVTAAVGCASTAANAAVTFYGPGAQNPGTTPATPAGINIGLWAGYRVLDTAGSSASFFRYGDFGATIFTRGTDLVGGGAARGQYADGSGFKYGAVAGDQNYANISFDGGGAWEAVGQFYLDGTGGGYLVAIATNDAPNQANALSISDGKALIDAVPEPSSLGLLALGSLGLLARRSRKAA